MKPMSASSIPPFNNPKTISDKDKGIITNYVKSADFPVPKEIKDAKFLRISDSGADYIFEKTGRNGGILAGNIVGARKSSNDPWEAVDGQNSAYFFINGATSVKKEPSNPVPSTADRVMVTQQIRQAAGRSFYDAATATPAGGDGLWQTVAERGPPADQPIVRARPPPVPLTVPPSELPQPPISMLPQADSRVAALVSSAAVYRQQASQVIVLAMSVPSNARDVNALIPLIDEVEKAKDESMTLDETLDVPDQIAELEQKIQILDDRTKYLHARVRAFYAGVWTLLDPNPFAMMDQKWLETLVVTGTRTTVDLNGVTVEGACVRGLRLLLAERYPRFRSSLAWRNSGTACDGIVFFFQYNDQDVLQRIDPYKGDRIDVDNTQRSKIMSFFSRGHGKHLLVTTEGYLIVAMRKARGQPRGDLAGFRGRPSNNQEAVPMWGAFIPF